MRMFWDRGIHVISGPRARGEQSIAGRWIEGSSKLVACNPCNPRSVTAMISVRQGDRMETVAVRL
jgi:hypothetical protein